MAFKMKGPSLYKNVGKTGEYSKSAAFQAVEGEEEKETKRLKTGGTVTIDSPTSKTYDKQATMNKLIDSGMSRKEAEAAVKLSMKAGSQRTTGDE